MNTILKDRLPEVIDVLKKHRVKRAYAFGSVTRHDFKLESDIDLLVDFGTHEPFDGYSENFWSLEEQLANLLNRKVDILAEHTLKNSFFIKEMEKTKVPLYE
jgi:uncharacterized protein